MLRVVLAALALVCVTAGDVPAQDYPVRPVKILVPTSPGGFADTLARALASHLSKATGQQFYVENRGGAANIIGIESVVQSPADGYTLLLGAGTITINQAIYKKLPFDVLRDLTPITQLVSVPNVLTVHPAQPFATLAQFIAAAKQKPGQLNYGSAGVGSNLHLSMEQLKTMAGIDVVHVPYKGVGPAMSDLLGGHLVSMVSNLASAKPHLDSGKLRALGVTSRNRSPAAPDVPSITESGITGYEALNWFGLFAAAGTPAPIIARISAETTGFLALPDTQQRLAHEGAVPVGSNPAEFAVFVRDEIKKWDAVARAAHIQPVE